MTALVLDVLIALAGGVAAFGLALDLIARAGMFGAPRGARPHDLLRDAPPPPAPRRRWMGERGTPRGAMSGAAGRTHPTGTDTAPR